MKSLIGAMAKQTRQWKIKKIDEHHYEGKAEDVVETAKGFSYGPAFKFEYVLMSSS